MEFKTKKGNNASVTITLKNTPEEVDEAFESAYIQAKQKLKLPGFRKGKAPIEVVKKQLGDSVANEAIRHLISESYKSIVDELDYPPISSPSFEVEIFDRVKGAKYSGTYDTYPDVKLSKYKKFKIVEDVTIISDEVVENHIRKIQKEHALIKTKDNEIVEMNDIATVEIEILDNDQSLFKNNELKLNVGDDKSIPGLEEHILDLKINEEKSYSTDFPEDFPNKDFAGKDLNIKIKVTEIQQPEYPKLDDEFARDVGEYESMEDLRGKIQASMEDYSRQVLKSKSQSELIEKIVESTQFTIPETLIQQEIKYRLDSLKTRMKVKEISIEDLAKNVGMKVEEIEKDLREASIKSLKENLAVVEISKKEEITVEKSEIEDEVRNKFGSSMNDEQIAELLEKGAINENINSNLVYQKTLDWIYEHADKKKGKDIAFEKLSEIQNVS